MKKKQWLQSLGGADDQFVLEAAPKGHARRRSGKAVRLISILAACMAFVLLCGTFALFIPYPTTPPSVAAYASSPYYGIIQKLNEYSYQPPAYKNTFDYLWHLPGELFQKVEDMAPGAADGMNGADSPYREVTDNQVAGVIEADRIKRSDTHAYYLGDDALYIYSLEGEDSRLISTFELPGSQNGTIYDTDCEFFLSTDCKTVTVLMPYLNKSTYFEHCVQVLALDVSDPTAVRQISTLRVSGLYLSARLTEHGLLLMTTMSCRKFDFDDPASFIPQIETEQGTQSIAPDSIIYPDRLSSASYTVMLMMNAEGTEVTDSAAFLSYAQDVYVSADAIYATRSFTEYGQAADGQRSRWTVSEISCMGYGADGFTKRGSVIVDGSVLDQYSMDQYQNTLRVVTTTNQGTEQVSDRHNGWSSADVLVSFRGKTNASLYVIDLATMKVAASVENFAPDGESVRSARFDGEMAYVCTAIQQTDPVFFFDLSDLENITVKETGTIAGFSTSLVNFGDGFLLGIGRGANGNELKVEVYVETEFGVESFAKYERPCTDYHPEYKCYYIDRENGLVGLGVYTWDKVYLDSNVYRYENYRYEYMVLHFDGQNVTEALRIRFGERDVLAGMRGVYVDGYYYVFNGKNFVVKPLVLE